jgi:hypothetical protein
VNLFNAIRGINGEPEIIRTTGAFGVFSYVVGALAFQAWALHRGDHFDIVAFCASFPGGLALAYGAISGAAALKDRNVAVAQTVSSTGAMPGKAANAPTDAPIDVNVTNTTEDRIPVENKS